MSNNKSSTLTEVLQEMSTKLGAVEASWKESLTKKALSKNVSIGEWNSLVFHASRTYEDIFTLKKAIDGVIAAIGTAPIEVQNSEDVVSAINILNGTLGEVATLVDDLRNFKEDFDAKLDRIILDEDGNGADPTNPDSVYNGIDTGEAVYTEHMGSDGKWRPILYPATGAALPGSSDQAEKEKHFNQLKSKRIVIAGTDGKVLTAAPDGTVYEGELGDSDTFINKQNAVVPQHYADLRYVKTSLVTPDDTPSTVPIRDDRGVFSVGDATSNKHVLNVGTANRKYVSKQTPAQVDSVYTVKRSGSEDAGFTWTDSSRPLSTTLTPGTSSIPLRNSAGRFEVGDIGGASKGTTNYQALNARSLIKHLNLVMDKDYKLSLVFDSLEKTGLPDDTEYVEGDALIGQIDLPLETMVMDAEYDSEAGVLRLTLNAEEEDGSKKVVEVPIADVITLDGLKLESTKTDNTYTIQLKNGNTPLGEPIEIVDEVGTDFDMDRLAIDGSLSGTALTLNLLYKDLSGDAEDVLIYSTSIDLSELSSGGGIDDDRYVKRLSVTDGTIAYTNTNGKDEYRYVVQAPLQTSIPARTAKGEVRTATATLHDAAVPLAQMQDYVAHHGILSLCIEGELLSDATLYLDLYYQDPDEEDRIIGISSASIDLSGLALGGGGGGSPLIPKFRWSTDLPSKDYAAHLPALGSIQSDRFSRTAAVGDTFSGLGIFADDLNFIYVGEVTGTHVESGDDSDTTYVDFSCISIAPIEDVARAIDALHADSATMAGRATFADTANTAEFATSSDSATKATQDGDGNTISTTYAKKAQLGLKAGITLEGKPTVGLTHNGVLIDTIDLLGNTLPPIVSKNDTPPASLEPGRLYIVYTD